MTDLEWEIMRSLSSVQGNQKEIVKIINGIDFSEFEHAQAIALDVFELTLANVKENVTTARKIAGFSSLKTLTGAYRLNVLKELLASVDR